MRKKVLLLAALALIPALVISVGGTGGAKAKNPWSWVPYNDTVIHRNGRTAIRPQASGVVFFTYDPAHGNLPAVAPGAKIPNAAFPNVKVNQDYGPFPHNETAATIAPHYSSPPYPHIMAGANDYRGGGDGGNGVYSSHAEGQLGTWQDYLEQGITSGPYYYNGAGDPVLASNMNGDVYYASLGFDRTTSRSAVIVGRMSYRNDTGMWADPFPVPVAFNDDGTFNDKEWIAVDNSPTSPYSNTVYVTWTRFGAGSPIYFSKSTSSGQTWSAPMEISGSSQAVCGGGCVDDQGSQVGVDSKGGIDVTFFNGDTNKNVAQTLFVRSTDGGKTWTTPVRVDYDTMISSPLPGTYFRTNSFPSMTVDPQTDQIYVTWPDFRYGEADILYSSSKDKGKTWSKPIIVNHLHGGSISHFMPAIATTGSGDVYVSFYSRPFSADGYMEYNVCGSKDGGKTWPRCVVASDAQMPNPVQFDGQFFGDYSGLAAEATGPNGDLLHPVWTDTRSGFNEDIYTTAILFSFQ